MADSPRPLSERERRFVEAYMGKAAGNGTEAARQAGYKGSANVLHVQGCRLLRKATVRAAIAERQQADPGIADRAERQHFWSTMMRDGREKSTDRLKASELLGRTGADFVERHEVSGVDGTPIHSIVNNYAVSPPAVTPAPAGGAPTR